jgi:hypothetical protein
MNCITNNFKNFKHHNDKALLMKFQELQTINGKNKNKNNLKRSNEQSKESPLVVDNMAIWPKIVTRILKR